MESRLADERVGELQLQVAAVPRAGSVVATVVGFGVPRKMRAGLDKKKNYEAESVDERRQGRS